MQGTGRLVLRTVVGALFVGHGSQKLFGTFGGPGLEGTTQMMRALDMHPARRNAVLAGLTEAGGGALLLAGLATPAAGAALVGVMTTAVRKVHLPKGVWNSDGGYEYNAVLVAALVALAAEGPGPLSLDRALGTERTGARWGLAALVAGVLGSTLVVELGRRGTEPEHEGRDATVQGDGGPAGPTQR